MQSKKQRSGEVLWSSHRGRWEEEIMENTRRSEGNMERVSSVLDLVASADADVCSVETVQSVQLVLKDRSAEVEQEVIDLSGSPSQEDIEMTGDKSHRLDSAKKGEVQAMCEEELTQDSFLAATQKEDEDCGVSEDTFSTARSCHDSKRFKHGQGTIQSCVICHKMFALDADPTERERHVDVCLEEAELDPIKRHSYQCKICDEDLSTADLADRVCDEEICRRISHVKKCALYHGIEGPEDLKQVVEQEQKRASATKPQVKEEAVLIENDPRKETPVGRDVNSYLMNSARKLVRNNFKNDAARASVREKTFSSERRQEALKPQPPTYKRILRSEFVVDGFSYHTKKYYFLTHFHADHYGGLSKRSLKPTEKIVCTPTTARLVQLRFGIAQSQFLVIGYNEAIKLKHHIIVCFDANHCPGAAMFFFYHLPTKRRTLHVGDFRYDESISLDKLNKLLLSGAISTGSSMSPILAGETTGLFPLDALYLDTTYCKPLYQFLPQSKAIKSAVSLVCRYGKKQTAKKLFVFGTYSIGKEKIFIHVINALVGQQPHIAKKQSSQSKQDISQLGKEFGTTGLTYIYCSKEKYRIYQCLDFDKLDSAFHKKFCFTTSKRQANFHIISGQMTLVSLFDYVAKPTVAAGCGKKYDAVIGVKATGWVKLPSVKHHPSNRATLVSVPYSEHSSFNELKQLMTDLKAKQRQLPELIPTVKTAEKYLRLLS